MHCKAAPVLSTLASAKLAHSGKYAWSQLLEAGHCVSYLLLTSFTYGTWQHGLL